MSTPSVDLLPDANVVDCPYRYLHSPQLDSARLCQNLLRRPGTRQSRTCWAVRPLLRTLSMPAPGLSTSWQAPNPSLCRRRPPRLASSGKTNSEVDSQVPKQPSLTIGRKPERELGSTDPPLLLSPHRSRTCSWMSLTATCRKARASITPASDEQRDYHILLSLPRFTIL